MKAADFHPTRSSSLRAFFAVLILALLWLLLATPVRAFEPSGDLEIHVINVQQGAATLVVGPDGTTVLMDAGNNGKGSSEIVPYLTDPDVGLLLMPADGLDYTLASHMHADHIGGFDDVLATAGYDVLIQNWHNGGTSTSGAFADYWTATSATTAGAPVEIPVGEVIDLGDGAALMVVACDGQVLGYGDAGPNDRNDLSVGVLIQYGYFDFIWAGDVGGGSESCTGHVTDQADVETPIASEITPGGSWPFLTGDGVEVLHVNHHGSDSSTNSFWMNLLRPEIATISVGSNAYGHPQQSVVESVLLSGAACVTAPQALVLQTDEGDLDDPTTSTAGYVVGDVKIVTDGTHYTVSATGEVSPGAPDESAVVDPPLQLRVNEVFLDDFESGDVSAWSSAWP